ncbi:L-asparaginase [Loktanella sp. 3ANDIMAR09]|uniref:asparaginase n=1 Tax=Loktanella sp. 3ANDIMAR09 TaxID=1225657 RepID=UPI0006F64EA9|nr:asparaginase [Loktanella sp. 3ANDIMAR09]KQI69987.1 L-asparaginase [Loktanella sp. 3ANDIMAR09]
MSSPAPLIEVHRGDMLESLHSGHAVVCDDSGQIVQAWGDPDAVIFPRSSCKMIQALPLIESGAADAHGLTSEQLALACASHQGAHIHTDRVQVWLDQLGLKDSDFRCGPQWPGDIPARNEIIRAHAQPCQIHNNCSGKHAGFLTLNRHLGGAADYELVDHPVQQAGKAAFEEVTGMTSPGYGIDGCSAPNFATSVQGLARAMASFASAGDRSDTRSQAMVRLTQAMTAHPELVAGETRACTDLMRAMDGRVAIKTGAEAVFVAIIPERKMGVALKITDGSTRGAEAAIAAILVKLGVLDPDHPATRARMVPEIRNWRGTLCGHIRPTSALL